MKTQMRTFLRSAAARDEAGSMLIEVVISASLLIMVSVGVFNAFDAATRSTAQERHRARAHSIAQSDLARMRTMRISDLWGSGFQGLDQTWTVTEDDQTYTVRSRAQVISDATGTASCDEGSSSNDYFKVSSTVTWSSIGGRPPVVAVTLVAPPNGSVNPNSGSLAIRVEDSQSVGIAGVAIAGSGAGSFSGVTDENGCAIFGNLPAGDYTLDLSGIASGLVDVDGNPPEPRDTSVVAESTNTVVFQYDEPGSVPVVFTTKNYANATAASNAEAIVVFNTGMSTARSFGTPGTRVPTITATSLFPFPSPYSIYAGTCEGHNPNPNELDPPPAPGAIAAVSVPPGTDLTTPATIQLPALHLTVYQGTSTSSSRYPGATLRMFDSRCSFAERSFTTNASGQLNDPGMPYSEYWACVQGTITGSLRHKWLSFISLNEPSDLTGGTVVNVFMGTGTSSGACA
jgi:Tfp pilus assembly protein PilV